MKILWISSIAWKNNGEYPYAVNGAGAVSGSLFQQSMIEGLEKLGHSVDIISDYPYAPGCNVHSQISWSHNDHSKDVAAKTIDIPYLSLLHKDKSLKCIVSDKVKNNKYDFAVAYLIHHPYMSALAYAKHLDSRIQTVLICPDLPDMMDMSLPQKKLKSFMKKIDKKRINKLYKKVDGFVLFAEPMLEKIDIGDSRYTVIEGIASVDDLDRSPVSKERFILHAGTLHRNIGIENIIDSLDYISDKSIKLKIFGTGELEEYIKEKAEKDPRIIYGGFIDRRSLFEEQKKAIALVNARNPKDAYTRYSFPSKTFEYLYSGTPFVTTDLEGIPTEYKEHLCIIHNNDPQEIAKKIEEVYSQNNETILKRGYNAQNFILRKTAIQQAKKMVHLLDVLQVTK